MVGKKIKQIKIYPFDTHTKKIGSNPIPTHTQKKLFKTHIKQKKEREKKCVPSLSTPQKKVIW